MNYFNQLLTLFRVTCLCVFGFFLASCTHGTYSYDQQQAIDQALQYPDRFVQQPATQSAPASFYVAPDSILNR